MGEHRWHEWICDRCGASVVMADDSTRLPEGWWDRPGDHLYCRECLIPYTELRDRHDAELRAFWAEKVSV